MRSLLILVISSSSLVASAQQIRPAPFPLKGWDAVRALSPGASLDIKLRKGSQKCAFRSADSESLTCHASADLTLQRADVRKITQHHRGRSTLVGLAVGAGAGAAIGAATTSPCGNICILGGKGFGASAGGVAVGLIGTLVGALTDFTQSTVYKAP